MIFSIIFLYYSLWAVMKCEIANHLLSFFKETVKLKPATQYWDKRLLQSTEKREASFEIVTNYNISVSE